MNSEFISDKNIVRTHEKDQEEAGVRDEARLTAAYYNTLLESGMDNTHAMMLTQQWYAFRQQGKIQGGQQ